MSKTGEEFEQLVSHRIHRTSVPILMSDKLLRNKSMGQVDIAYKNKFSVIVAECKQGSGRLSKLQLTRLSASSKFLSTVLNQEVNLIGIQQVAKLNDAEYPFRVCNIRELM